MSAQPQAGTQQMRLDLTAAERRASSQRPSWVRRRVNAAHDRVVVSASYRWLMGCEFGEPVERLLRAVVMLGLLLTAALTAIAAVAALLISLRHREFASTVAVGLNSTLLIFIVLELVQTVRQQIDAKERLSRNLVCNFLVIGVLSSVRHLLGVGAEMTLVVPKLDVQAAASAARQGQLVELCVTAVIVLVLVSCWWIAGGRGLPYPRRTGSKGKSKGSDRRAERHSTRGAQPARDSLVGNGSR